jgi:hypothetical protein
MTTATRHFLSSTKLLKYESILTDLGVDMETLSDRNVCNDVFLAQKVGMSKMDIRKLRKIESTQTGATFEEAHVSSQVAKHDTEGASLGMEHIDKDKDTQSRPGDLLSSPSGGGASQGTTF